mmetsp:Transcript_6550/g.19908  ORF Transcript_6550/g.19908 Transcript_6550/m.19908 type:complete len:264 (-) Transcript_6550:662-1453(-)
MAAQLPGRPRPSGSGRPARGAARGRGVPEAQPNRSRAPEALRMMFARAVPGSRPRMPSPHLAPPGAAKAAPGAVHSRAPPGEALRSRPASTPLGMSRWTLHPRRATPGAASSRALRSRPVSARRRMLHPRRATLRAASSQALGGMPARTVPRVAANLPPPRAAGNRAVARPLEAPKTWTPAARPAREEGGLARALAAPPACRRARAPAGTGRAVPAARGRLGVCPHRPGSRASRRCSGPRTSGRTRGPRSSCTPAFWAMRTAA